MQRLNRESRKFQPNVRFQVKFRLSLPNGRQKGHAQSIHRCRIVLRRYCGPGVERRHHWDARIRVWSRQKPSPKKTLNKFFFFSESLPCKINMQNFDTGLKVNKNYMYFVQFVKYNVQQQLFVVNRLWNVLGIIWNQPRIASGMNDGRRYWRILNNLW